MAKVLESYVCCRCGEAKPREGYGTRTTPTGRSYRLTRCGTCEYKRKLEKEARNPESAAIRNKRHQETQRAQHAARRLDPSWTARIIVKDARQSDRRKGRENNLTAEFVEKLIADGCHYCGDDQIRMTTDRIDNLIGHVETNVLPACIRCNMIRGSMPFEAWMVIAPSIREARISGLFGDWMSVPLMRQAQMNSADNYSGGDEGDRTPDLRNAIASLSQLSYVPAPEIRQRLMVEPGGIEPPTSSLQRRRSTI